MRGWRSRRLSQSIRLRPPRPVASPVRKQERREAAVADQPAVSAGVAKSGNGVRIEQHLAHGAEITVGVVEERPIQQRFSVVAEQQVVGELCWRDTSTCCLCGDALFGMRLVVGRIAEHEHAIEGLQQERGHALGLLGEQALPEGRVAHDPQLVTVILVGDLAEARVRGERVEGGAQAQHDPDRTRGDLRLHRQTFSDGASDPIEQLAPLPRRDVGLGHADRHRASRGAHHRAKQLELFVELAEVANHLEDSPTGAAQRARDPEELRKSRRQARRERAILGAVVGRARARESERPRVDRLADQPPHRLDLMRFRNPPRNSPSPRW